ncbi:MAG: hypothetical protein GY811_07215 [Myxococcales bacterium]|nr:hypothetical protein [Myxococcales bacterium]
MRRTSPTLAAPLLLVATSIWLPACAPNDGGQVGEETVVCQAVESAELDPSEESPLGFAAEQVLTRVIGQHLVPLRWSNGESTELTAEFTLVGSLKFHDREWIDTSTGDAAEPTLEIERGDCLDIIEVEMQMNAATDDGRLAESWSVLVQTTSADSTSISHAIDGLDGTLDIASFAPEAPYDALTAYLEARFESDGLVGSVSGQSESSDGEVASATSFDIASFGSSSGD